MYLKALEIQGFKSFAEKTVLTFDKNITGIVGPNGSGKSNISDAILWVMGEQRTRALRGTKMEDVIFGGTTKRSPLGFAQVSLVLDNSARIFDYDSDEVVLTRRYYRSGESEYQINRENVRLKDITTLLLDTGLGRDGYSIIGQGRIAEIISSRSTDRREVFEEAAGIARYRFRKEEAEHKLEHTDENLVRINDKIEELELQVVPLKKQAETAKKYLSLRDKLKVQEISVWMESLDHVRHESEAIRLEFEQTKSELEKTKSDLEALYRSSESLTERMHCKDGDMDDIRRHQSELESVSAGLAAEAEVLKANIAGAEENRKKLLEDIAGQESRVHKLRESISSAEARLAELDSELKIKSEDSIRCANAVEGCRIKIRSREDNVTQLTDKANALQVEKRTLDANISMLERMERDYEGFSRAVKTVMREKARGTLRGIHGPVANLLRTDAEYALAIETALGAAGQNIIVDSQNDGRLAIEMLKRTDSGRATFLPLDTITGAVMKDAPVQDPGFVGIAYELIDTQDSYARVFMNLLGRTVIAESLTDAVRMSKNNGNRLRIVTLDGQLINPGGSMTGGSTSKGTGILSRANELESLRKKQEKLAKDAAAYDDRLQKAKMDLSAVRYQLDMALESQTAVKTELSSIETEKRTTSANSQQMGILLEGLSGDSEIRRSAVKAQDDRVESLNIRLAEKQEELSANGKKIEEVKGTISQLSKERLELEAKRVRAERETQQKNNDIIELERRSARIEQKKQSSEMEEKQLLDKLWDSYELSYNTAMELRQPVENLKAAIKAAGELRREMNALGNPNLGAIEEYERVNTRYEFLTGQRDDVVKARNELLGIISDITSEMEKIFIEKFREIDTCFRETFLELFGGGRASLMLEDENNVLECGIEIKAQPPGKALSSINLLSGGEKAFVAIALYFAILKVRPTPFCVMDEIEAALDEANVIRYADYMRKMSDKTQFLVITHRRGTMEEADTLYGVTMQEKGISTVLTLDVETAEKSINAV